MLHLRVFGNIMQLQCWLMPWSSAQLFEGVMEEGF
jgi:hypothetical protein